MLLLAVFVLVCTAIGWFCNHPVAGFVVGLVLAVLAYVNEVRL